MPTYTWGCSVCGCSVEQYLPLREYVQAPPQFVHCGEPMQRLLQPVMVVGSNDASYAGLRAPDGADISSRAKHRAYMREHNVTTVDDFAQTWRRQAEARRQRLAGVDAERAQDIARAIDKLGG